MSIIKFSCDISPGRDALAIETRATKKGLRFVINDENQDAIYLTPAQLASLISKLANSQTLTPRYKLAFFGQADSEHHMIVEQLPRRNKADPMHHKVSISIADQHVYFGGKQVMALIAALANTLY